MTIGAGRSSGSIASAETPRREARRRVLARKPLGRCSDPSPSGSSGVTEPLIANGARGDVSEGTDMRNTAVLLSAGFALLIPTLTGDAAGALHSAAVSIPASAGHRHLVVAR